MLLFYDDDYYKLLVLVVPIESNTCNGCFYRDKRSMSNGWHCKVNYCVLNGSHRGIFKELRVQLWGVKIVTL